jgi:hypothetical protein
LVLDRYNEKKPQDPTIRAKFNTYRFADYEEKVIDLLARVTAVSLRTQAIVTAMKGSPRYASVCHRARQTGEDDSALYR